MTNQQTFVIVGASLAGAKAAEMLRVRGFAGRIMLIGAEPDRPYERPPLSKGYLTGNAGPDTLYVHEPDHYADLSIELRTSTVVSALSPAQHTVTLADGEVIHYTKALLATGAAPRRLTGPGATLDGVHYLRTRADADRLVAAAGSATSAAVIGAGWIGAEVAAALRQRGLPVALIEPAATPLERVLGREVGEIYRQLHADHGVSMHLGEALESLHGTSRVEELRTTSGSRLAVDLVVVGIGAVPRTELAAAAGLPVDNGILTDEYLRSGHPDVYAAGDVARAWHPRYGVQLRVEHWANAAKQGSAAAANMLGAAEAYTEIPYFFSDQYEFGMEYTGYCPTWDRVVFRGDPSSRTFIAFWLHRGRPVAAMNANIWDVGEDLRDLVRCGVRVDPDRLADRGVPLAALVADVADA